MSHSTLALRPRHGARVVSLSPTGTPARQSAGSPAGSLASPSSDKSGPAAPGRGGPTPRPLPDIHPWRAADNAACGYVEVLTDPATGEEIGFRLVGRSAGPVVVVAGLCPSAKRIFDRLLSIPTLPWMRGTLILLHLDALPDHGRLADVLHLGRVDRTIALPWSLTDRSEAWGIVRSYHAVLRVCTQLGMISGRGVPRARMP